MAKYYTYKIIDYDAVVFHNVLLSTSQKLAILLRLNAGAYLWRSFCELYVKISQV